MIRVAHVITRLNVGGPAIQLMAQAEVLSGLIDQVVITGRPQPGESDIREIASFDLPVIEIDSLCRPLGPLDARAVFETRRALSRLSPDIVHTHTSKGGLVGRLAAWSLPGRVPTVHTFHATMSQQYQGRTQRVVLGLERTLARRTSRLVCLSDSAVAEHQAAGIGAPSKYRVIPGQLSADRFTVVSRADARAEFDLAPESTVVAYVGRLDAIKRFDRFIDVIEDVHRRGITVTAVVAGSGPEADASTAQMNRLRQRGIDVRHYSWLAEPQRLLAAADALVIPSDSEGLPLVLLEAAIQRTPVISTDVGSIGDLIIDGATGTLCARDTIRLADGLVAVLDDRERAARMAEKLHGNVLDRIHPNTVRPQLLDLYDSVLEVDAQDRPTAVESRNR